MSYPENCIRGIPNEQFLTEERTAATSLFLFDPNAARPDGWVAGSINWEDDDSAIGFTLNQKKDTGEIQFRVGIAVLPRVEIDKLGERPGINGRISYERESLKDNPYHGNILLDTRTSKELKRMIAANLALFSRIILREEAGSP